ncbi:MAG: hypothetical protein AMJ92_05720 [candidate division Zixibacteria bacterium SM23_81]|nr:MAG: hypothetical protein AMJ92_05720 [candidate division Zixibacteria bacterium SM23_81]
MEWLSTISPIVLGLTLVYCGFLLWILWGLFRLSEGRSQLLHSVSVVVAAKNEERSIESCLRALLAQDYPPEQYEIVVVDDASTDATADIVQSIAWENSRVRLLRAQEGRACLRAKKRALQMGIEHSAGEIILLTDADCLPAPTWIKTMVRHFEPSVGLVAGHVHQGGQLLWQKLRSLERLSMAAMAAGAIGWNQGLSANGGNLGYRREVFREVAGFKSLSAPLSGDDDLFIQLVSRKTSWEFQYAFEPEAAVSTKPPANLRQFVAQERRRTSKGRYYPTWVQAILIEAFMMNLALIITLPFSLCYLTTHPLPWGAFVGKALCELLILIRASRLFKRKGLLRFSPLAVFLHIPYFVVFSIWGTLGSYRWKAETALAHRCGDCQTASW